MLLEHLWFSEDICSREEEVAPGLVLFLVEVEDVVALRGVLSLHHSANIYNSYHLPDKLPSRL